MLDWGCRTACPAAGLPKIAQKLVGVPKAVGAQNWGAQFRAGACLGCPTRVPSWGLPNPNLGVPKSPNCGCQKLGCLTAQSWVPKTGVPKSGGAQNLPHPPPREPVAKAPQQQTQKKNCRAHLRQSLLSHRRLRNKHKRRIANLPKSLLSQRPSRNKHKRRIATPTSPKACRKGTVETNTNEEWQFFVRVCFWGFLCVSRLWGGWCGNSSYFSRVISCVVTVV